MITIVGLGRFDGDLTMDGVAAISSAASVIVKSNKTDTFRYFVRNNIKCVTCDRLYDKADNFDELNSEIVKLLNEHIKKHGDVTFCVNGCGSDDTTIELLKKMQIPYRIINGVGYQENILQHYPTSNYVCVSASSVNNRYLCSDVATVVKEIDSRLVASEVKLSLSKVYDEETDIELFNNMSVNTIKLFELDQQVLYDVNTTAYVPVKPLLQRKVYGFNDLITILQILRGDNGCPWDKAQTHKSIRGNAIEEAYEVAEAIDNNDMAKLQEELGDLLLQPMLQTKIAMDDNEFDYTDVISQLVNKLISRHTHIFGSDKVTTDEQALKTWEANKIKEQEVHSYTEDINNVPTVLTALMRAAKVTKRAARSGLDTTLQQTVEEIKSSVNDMSIQTEEMVGDILLKYCNMCRFLNINAEVALSRATNKFIKRFSYVEEAMLMNKQPMNKDNREVMKQLWQQAVSEIK